MTHRDRLAVDVVVVGGGNAALCAALTARQFVDSVLILEAAPIEFRGGNTRHTRNIRHVHLAGDEIVTGSYPADELWEDLVKVSHSDIDADMARLVIDNSESVPQFMESHGIGWQLPLKGTLHLSRTNRFFLGGGKAMLNSYYASASAVGISVMYNADVTEIEFDGAGLRHLSALIDDVEHHIIAKAAVVASGGFEANKQWLSEYWGEAAQRFIVRGSPHNTGGPLRSMLDHGAKSIGDPQGAHAISVDARAPEFDGGIVTRIDSVPLSVMVNLAGERFSDEGADLWPRRYASWGHLIAAQPDQMAFSIFDAKVRDKFIPGIFPPVEGETLEQLSTKIGLPKERFLNTLSNYNAAISDDVAFDHTLLDGRRTRGLEIEKSNWANRIDTPPFYAYPLRPGITFTYMGVKVDRRANVQMETGPVLNLFAAGEIMSGNVLTAGYLAGFGLTIGAVFGRIAGENAGKYAASC